MRLEKAPIICEDSDEGAGLGGCALSNTVLSRASDLGQLRVQLPPFYVPTRRFKPSMTPVLIPGLFFFVSYTQGESTQVSHCISSLDVWTYPIFGNDYTLACLWNSGAFAADILDTRGLRARGLQQQTHCQLHLTVHSDGPFCL